MKHDQIIHKEESKLEDASKYFIYDGKLCCFFQIDKMPVCIDIAGVSSYMDELCFSNYEKQILIKDAVN